MAEKTAEKRFLADLDKACAAACGVEVAVMHSKTQSHDVSRARHLAWLVLSAWRGWGSPRIAKAYDRDHSTILYGFDRAVYMVFIRCDALVCDQASAIFKALRLSAIAPDPNKSLSRALERMRRR